MDTPQSLESLLQTAAQDHKFQAILLHGPSGCGKSHLINKCTQANNYTIRSLTARDLSTDEAGTIEKTLDYSFRRNAASVNDQSQTPVAIIIDHLEIWAPADIKSPIDMRIIAALNDSLAALHEEKGCQMVFIATTTTPSAVHSSLIRPGRISHLLPLNALSFQQRRLLFRNWLAKTVPADTPEDALHSQAAIMARATPGFLPSDTSSLFSCIEDILFQNPFPHAVNLKTIQQVFASSLQSVTPSLLSASATASNYLLNNSPHTDLQLFGLDTAIQQMRECLSAVFMQEFNSTNTQVTETVHAIRQLGAFKGIMIHGPTASGKSALAKLSRSMVALNSVNFIFMDSTSIVSSVIGEAERNLASLLSTARSIAPAIVVMDNIDTLAPYRNDNETVDGSGRDASTQTFNRLLSTFLVELDGLKSFSAERPIFLIGTTRSLQLIDPALLRPGRFELHIALQPPDRTAQADIVQSFCARRELNPDALDAICDYFGTRLSSGETYSWTAPEIFSIAREIVMDLGLLRQREVR